MAVLTVFLAGEQSDFDLVLVLKGNKEGKDHWTLHAGNIDATCMSAERFATRLADHAFLCLVPYWVPPEWQWRRVAKLVPASLGPINRAALHKSISGAPRLLVIRVCAQRTQRRLNATGAWRRRRRRRGSTSLPRRWCCMRSACCASRASTLRRPPRPTSGAWPTWWSA